MKYNSHGFATQLSVSFQSSFRGAENATNIGAHVIVRHNTVLKYTNKKGHGNLLLGAAGLIELGNFGSNYAVVNDLNNKGEMVGWMQAPDGSLQAFLASPAQ